MITIIWIVMMGAMVLAAMAADNLCLLIPAVLCLLLPLLSFLMLWPGRKQLRLELEAPLIIQKNQKSAIRFQISRQGRILPGRLLLVLRISNCLTGETDTIRWRPGKDPELELDSRYCGCLELEAVKVLESDWFGVLYLSVPCQLQKRILVMPDTFPVAVSSRLNLSMQDDCQDYSQTQRGQDRTETFQIRDYVPGDPLNQIHWKLSGKRGSLIVREASLPMDRSLTVFVDMASGTFTPGEADALTEAASSVCRALTDAGMTFHFSWSSAEMQFLEVSSLEQFSEALAAFLRDKSAVKAGGKDIFTLQEETGEHLTGRILWFSKELPENQDLLDRLYDCQYFICGSVSSRTGNCYRFSADQPEAIFQTDVL